MVIADRGFLDGRVLTRVGSHFWLLHPDNLIDHWILKRDSWEPTTEAAMRSLVRPGMTAIDIGANIGWFTVFLSDLVGPTGNVIGIEPMYEAALLAQAHLVLNKLPARVMPIALTDRESTGTVQFNYAWQADPTDTVIKQVENSCQFMTLDEFVVREKIAKIGAIKIDTDGYEDHIIRGGAKTLERFHPTLFLEVCDYTLRGVKGLSRALRETPAYGEAVREMLGRIEKLGYTLLREDRLEPVSIDAILTETDLSRSSVNIVCTVKNENA